MEARIWGAAENLWSAKEAGNLSDLEALAYRSNLLGSDRAVANYGGGNTSTKARERDHAGREVDVLWVKGSGSDLATIAASQFTGLRLGEVLPLMERQTMSDEEMVAYLAACQLRPEMPRGSIETLLHAFVPYPHVDHTHPDAINMLCCSPYPRLYEPARDSDRWLEAQERFQRVIETVANLDESTGGQGFG